MDLVRFDPFRELEDMSERLNRVFQLPARRRTRNGETEQHQEIAQWAPLVDIAESDKEYLITVEIPQVKRQDVKVTVQDGVLTISGERRYEKEDKGKKYHRIERAYGNFIRSFAVPNDADDAKVEAEFTEGVLNVHLPKSEKARPRQIDVKVK